MRETLGVRDTRDIVDTHADVDPKESRVGKLASHFQNPNEMIEFQATQSND
jgi:hypothetical protein